MSTPPLHMLRWFALPVLSMACVDPSNGKPDQGSRNTDAGGHGIDAGASGMSGSSAEAAGTSSSGALPAFAGALGYGGATHSGGVSGSEGPATSGGKFGHAGALSSGGEFGAAGTTSQVTQVQAAGTCTSGQIFGSPISSACFSSSDLEKFGCVPGTVTVGGVQTTIASRAQMESAVFSITYSSTSQVVAYLCTGSTPDAGWLCGTPLLGSCTNINDQSSCGRLYILSPMPLYTVTCAN